MTSMAHRPPRCSIRLLFATAALWELSLVSHRPGDALTFSSAVVSQGRVGEDGKKRRRFEPSTAEERLLWSLGCQLWSVGKDMVLAGASVSKGEIGASRPEVPQGPQGRSTTSHLPTLLERGGASLQDAGAALLDGLWSAAWRKLEVAALSSHEYWPAPGFQGLVDLVFSYAEPVPQFRTWGARDSLEHLENGLEAAMDSIDQNNDLQYPYRERAEALLSSAAWTLRDATFLFDGGEFYLPKDPRGVRYHDCDDDFWDNEEDEDELGTVNDKLEYSSGDIGTAVRIREIQKELMKADSEASRRKVLNRLVRENHPDQNPGREEEVRPIFEYCLRMLRLCKDSSQDEQASNSAK